MSYRSILVHVDSSTECTQRIELAASLAKKFGAHLTGLFTNWLPVLEVSMAEIPVYDVTAASHDYAESSAHQAQTIFAKVASGMGLDKVEWRQRIGQPLQTLYLNARYHDLVIIGQYNPEQHIDNLPNDLVQLVVLGAGRPVLVVPFAGTFRDVGHHVLVGREATRALTDAIPLLKKAKKTMVQTFNSRAISSEQGELPGGDISLYLARHGVEVELLANIDGVVDSGNQLLSTVADTNADLLVMGAYGHSHLLEIVLGGVTKTVLDSMTIPVLMSH